MQWRSLGGELLRQQPIVRSSSWMLEEPVLQTLSGQAPPEEQRLVLEGPRVFQRPRRRGSVGAQTLQSSQVDNASLLPAAVRRSIFRRRAYPRFQSLPGRANWVS